VHVSTELTTEKVQLSIADETGSGLTDKLADEFTKQHPNITFNVNHDTFDNVVANTPKLLAGDAPPDLVRLPMIGATVKNGLLANLDPYAKAYGWDKWPASPLASLRETPDGVRGSGSLYQLGLGYQVTGIYMNKKLASQLGISGTPKTLSELQNDMAKAKASGITPVMQGNKSGHVLFALQAVINQYADKARFQDWLFAKPGSSFNTPGSIKGADLVRQWADAGYFPSDINAIDYAEMQSRFEEGKGLFSFDGSWTAANYQKKLGNDVAFFLVPTANKGDKHVAMGAANSYSVAAKSKHQNEAAYFLNWTHTDPAARQIVVNVTGAAPGGDPNQAQPKTSGALISQVLQGYAQIGKEDGQVDFLANTTAGIFSGALIPDSQLLVTDKMTGHQFAEAVQAFFLTELKNQ
jgi:multiple sugar transport system substrate-binding protein/raffinose/stachyose/melibiose transport system substrate-binding protein